MALRSYRQALEVSLVLFTDTDPQTEAVWLDLLRQASPARKLAMVGELNAAVRTLALAGLRQRFPDANTAGCNVAWPTCSWNDLAREAYGAWSGELSDDL